MQIDTYKTCWHKDFCCDKMNEFYDTHVKGKNIDQLPCHIKVLLELFNTISEKDLLVIDVGCGTASSSEIVTSIGFEYMGFDLPHIIENCAKRNYPNYQYIKGSIDSHYDYLGYADILLLNAFIDVMEHPIISLDKILSVAENYVIIHRQEISETKETHSVINESYGGVTFHSIINRNDFNNILDHYNFEIVKELNCDFAWENGGSSFLLKKK